MSRQGGKARFRKRKRPLGALIMAQGSNLQAGVLEKGNQVQMTTKLDPEPRLCCILALQSSLGAPWNEVLLQDT